MHEQNQMSEQESLQLIHQMINKAKGSYHETGIGPLLWGTIIALCSIVTYCEIKFNLELPFDIWLLTIIAIIPQVVISIKEGKQRKALRYEDVAVGYVWLSFAICIFLLIHVNANIFKHLNPILSEYGKNTGTQGFNYNDYVSALFLMLYGMPSVITGGITGFKPMIIGGVICWVFSIISVYTPGDVDMLLVCMSAIAAWLIPGIILRRRFLLKKKEANV